MRSKFVTLQQLITSPSKQIPNELIVLLTSKKNRNYIVPQLLEIIKTPFDKISIKYNTQTKIVSIVWPSQNVYSCNIKYKSSSAHKRHPQLNVYLKTDLIYTIQFPPQEAVSINSEVFNIFSNYVEKLCHSYFKEQDDGDM